MPPSPSAAASCPPPPYAIMYYIHTHTYIHVYIYIYIERERDIIIHICIQEQRETRRRPSTTKAGKQRSKQTNHASNQQRSVVGFKTCVSQLPGVQQSVELRVMIGQNPQGCAENGGSG